MSQQASTSSDSNPVNTINAVVLVGHCGFDQSSITRAVSAALPGCTIKSVNDSSSLDGYTGPDSLLLINRVLDGRFATGSGIDLIADLASHDAPPKMMLISNYPDAQAQAVQAGALPGFGKNELGTPETTGKLKAV